MMSISKSLFSFIENSISPFAGRSASQRHIMGFETALFKLYFYECRLFLIGFYLSAFFG